MKWSDAPRSDARIIEMCTLPMADIADLCATKPERTRGGHVLDVRFDPDGAMNILISLWFTSTDRDLPHDRSILVQWAGGAPVATVLNDLEKPSFSNDPVGASTGYFHPILTDDGIVHLAEHLTTAVFTPIDTGQPLPHRPLTLVGTAPRASAQPGEAAGSVRIPQHSIPIYSNGMICVPSTTTAVATSFGFLRHDVAGRTLIWQDWPETKARSGGLFGLFRKAQGTVPDIRQIGAEQGLQALEAAAATQDGVFIHSAGDRHNPKYGDHAVAVLHMSESGDVRCLLYENYRPDGVVYKKRGLRPRFSQDGQRVMLRSTYKSTDPFKGGTGVIDGPTGALSVIDMPRGFRGAEIYAMQGDRALIAKPFSRGADLTFALCTVKSREHG